DWLLAVLVAASLENTRPAALVWVRHALICRMTSSGLTPRLRITSYSLAKPACTAAVQAVISFSGSIQGIEGATKRQASAVPGLRSAGWRTTPLRWQANTKSLHTGRM